MPPPPQIASAWPCHLFASNAPLVNHNLQGLTPFPAFIGHGSGLSEPDTPYKNQTAAILAAKRIFEEIPDRCTTPCSDWDAAKNDLLKMFAMQDSSTDRREAKMREVIRNRFSDRVLYNERDFYINSSIYLGYLGLPDTYDWRN